MQQKAKNNDMQHLKAYATQTILKTNINIFFTSCI